MTVKEPHLETLTSEPLTPTPTPNTSVPFDTRTARYAAEYGSTNEARQWLVKACDHIEDTK